MVTKNAKIRLPRKKPRIYGILGAQGLWAGRDLYHATPAVTRDLGFSGLIWMTTPFSRPLRHTRGCGGSILTRILTGPKASQVWGYVIFTWMYMIGNKKLDKQDKTFDEHILVVNNYISIVSLVALLHLNVSRSWHQVNLMLDGFFSGAKLTCIPDLQNCSSKS
jgi:hypothetical protein